MPSFNDLQQRFRESQLTDYLDSRRADEDAEAERKKLIVGEKDDIIIEYWDRDAESVAETLRANGYKVTIY